MVYWASAARRVVRIRAFKALNDAV